jgi:hypothetical protein
LAGFLTTAKVGFCTYLGSGCKPCRWLVGYSPFFIELHFTYPLQTICNAYSKTIGRVFNHCQSWFCSKKLLAGFSTTAKVGFVVKNYWQGL